LAFLSSMRHVYACLRANSNATKGMPCVIKAEVGHTLPHHQSLQSFKGCLVRGGGGSCQIRKVLLGYVEHLRAEQTQEVLVQVGFVDNCCCSKVYPAQGWHHIHDQKAPSKKGLQDPIKVISAI